VWWLVLAGLLAFGLSPAWSLEIREFLSDNETGLTDEEGKFEDWIEIYNDSGNAIDLGGYHLTDDSDELTKWRFPTLQLAGGGTLVVFASNENRRDPAGTLHTNFKLSRGGDYLALTDPSGVVLDHFDPEYPPQYDDVSYSDAGYHSIPTPGAANNGAVTGLPPRIRDVMDEPGMVPVGSEIVVTARVTQTSTPIRSVTCIVRKMFGGETTLQMSPLGDDVYITSFFATGLQPGEMVRWRIEARDSANRLAESPAHAEDPLDRDRYFGTVVTDSSLASSNMPILHWFLANPAGAETEAGARGSVYFLGRFYDNVNADIHGQSTRGFPKKSFDLDFNRGNRFVWQEGEGKVKDINLLSNWADKTKFRNTLAWEALGKIGAPHHFAYPVRVQQNGAFFSTADMVEDGDDRFLERNGLDGDGALYKMYNRLTGSIAPGAEKKTRDFEDNSDLQGLIDGLNSADPVRYSWDNLDLPMTLNTLAGYVLVQSKDQGHKNYYVYRDSEDTGEWGLIAWDNDLTLGHNWVGNNGGYFDDTIYFNDPTTFGQSNMLKDLMFNDPVFRSMLDRRLRTVMDEWLKPPGTPAAELYFENRVQDLLAEIDPPGITSDADRDYSKWGSWGNNNRMRSECNRVLNNYFNQRRTYVYNNLGMPAAQSANVAVNFGTVDVTPASGNQREEYIQIVNPNNTPVDLSGWSVTGGVEHVFSPGTVVPANGTGRNRLYLAKDSASFRARFAAPRGNQNLFVQEGFDGRLSARGETLFLVRPNGSEADTLTTPNNASSAQNQLRVTELDYHPAPATLAERAVDAGLTGDDFEYVELQNIGGTSLNVSGVQLVEGVRFVLPGGTQIPAGAYLVIAKNPSAFALRHPDVATPNGAQVLGPYEGYLSNGGERVQLFDALGESVQDFKYDDDWYPLTDGGGTSLEILDPAGDLVLWDEAAGWQPSGAPGGSPGGLSPASFELVPVPQLDAPEQVVFAYDLVVTDAAQPPRALGFSLQGNVPFGVSISANGRISWTPLEAAGPGTYAFEAVATDAFIPPNVQTQAVQIVVSEANRPPVLDAIAPQQIDESVAWSINLSASDPDVPAQSISYQLLDRPAGMTLAGNTVSWTPTEAQGPGSYTVRARVEDELGARRTRTFTITVNEVNDPPVIVSLANPGPVDERTVWTHRVVAQDKEGEAVSFSIANAPVGMVLDADTGWLRWLPGSDQGGSTVSFQVVATDAAGAASLAQVVQLVVNDVSTGSGGPCNAAVVLVPKVATWSWSTELGLGSAWREPWFDASAWSSGSAPFGYGETGLGTVTVGNVLRTTFVRTFSVNDVHELSGLVLRVRRDDSMIVYLNGEEIARDNLPGGTVGEATAASSSVFGAAETQFQEFPIPVVHLAEGQNTIAVGVHQVAVNSNDMVFDAELVAVRSVSCSPPMIDQDIFRGQGMLKFNTDVGLQYEVQGCDNLEEGIWVPLSIFTAVGSVHEFADPGASGPMRRFYRVRRLP